MIRERGGKWEKIIMFDEIFIFVKNSLQKAMQPKNSIKLKGELFTYIINQK